MEERKTGLHISLLNERLEIIDNLAEEMNMDRKGFFNNAVALFELAVEGVKQGKVLAVLDEDSGEYSEIVLPWMSEFRGEKEEE